MLKATSLIAFIPLLFFVCTTANAQVYLDGLIELDSKDADDVLAEKETVQEESSWTFDDTNSDAVDPSIEASDENKEQKISREDKVLKEFLTAVLNDADDEVVTAPRPVSYKVVATGRCTSPSLQQCTEIANKLGRRMLRRKQTWAPPGCFYKSSNHFVYYNLFPSRRRCDRRYQCLCQGVCKPQGCRKPKRPACGTNGKLYDSQCALRNAKCTTPGLVEAGRMWCLCTDPNPKPCSKVKIPTCGTNGKMYRNHCELQMARCKNPSIDQVARTNCLKRPKDTKKYARYPGR